MKARYGLLATVGAVIVALALWIMPPPVRKAAPARSWTVLPGTRASGTASESC